MEPCQVRIVRASRSLLMGPGTPYTVLPEWDPWSRTVRADQSRPHPYAHGSVVGSEWMDEAVVLIPVSVHRGRSTRAEWMEAHQQLVAAFAAVGDSREICELHFEWGGREYAMFGRPRPPRVTTDNVAVGKSVEQCAFVAADPRIYSNVETLLSTGLPIQRGGLTVPITVPVTVDGVAVGGRLDLVNEGTAPAGVRVRIDGPVSEPGLVLQAPDGSVQSVRFNMVLDAGQWLDIDSTTRTAFLNGFPSANRRPNAAWRMESHPLLPGTTRARFLAGDYSPAAQLTASMRSAWW